jgi:glycerophosphoryl diester phosphodiesterase
MVLRYPRDPFPQVPTGPRPLLVAHRGGNGWLALRRALTAGVDWLEADVWWQAGRVVARHDPTLWRLPLTYSRYRLGLAPIPTLTLEHLLDAVAGTGVRLLLDLKGDAPELPHAIVASLARRDAFAQAALCGQDWRPLDAARALDGRVQVIFSLGREEHLPAYTARLADGTAPHAASVNHRLLTPARVAALRQHGVTILAWTVNDPARARALLAWGVDGITSDSLRLLSSLRAASPSPGRG